MHKTILLTRAEIAEMFGMADALSAVEAAFRCHGLGKVGMPPKIYLDLPKGDLRCMPAYIPEMNAAGVKIVNVHPENKEFPSVMAIFELVDPETGFPLAVMDATLITSLRTGAAGGVAAKYLSREDARTIGFIGAGTQARTQLEAVRMVRPGISPAIVYDVKMESALGFAEFCRKEFGMDADIAGSPGETARQSDVLVTTTPSRVPIVQNADVKPGTHVNAIGADAAGKEELDPDLLKHSRIVVDDWEQARHSGEINVPISKGILSRDDVYASIGEIVAGIKAGRNDPDEITIFDSTGLAVQDVACAVNVYRKAISAQESGRPLNSLGLTT